MVTRNETGATEGASAQALLESPKFLPFSLFRICRVQPVGTPPYTAGEHKTQMVILLGTSKHPGGGEGPAPQHQ